MNVPDPETYDPPEIGTRVLMSEMQQALWLGEQLSPSTVANHISAALRIYSTLDVDRFKRSIDGLVELNPLFRARFDEIDGSPRQLIIADSPTSFQYVPADDWTSEQVRDRLMVHHAKPFDLVHEPPIRFLLLRQPDGAFLFSIAAHHLVADLWSLVLAGDEIRQLYETGRVEVRSTRTLDYADFVEAENDIEVGIETASEHYRARFAGWTAPEAEWLDDSLMSDGLAGMHRIGLTADEAAGVERAASELGVSLRALVLAAFQTAIHRDAHLDRLVVGEVKANRSSRFAALMGCCVNVVPRFAPFGGSLTLRDLAEAIEKADRADRRFDRVPFRALLRELRPDVGPRSFFAAMFAWQRSVGIFDEATTTAFAFGTDAGAVDLGAFSVAPVAMPVRSATAPLTLVGGSGPEGLVLALDYQLDVVSAATVERLGRAVRSVLQTMVSDADAVIADLDMRLEDQRHRDASEWSSTERPMDENVTALDMILSRVAERSGAVAVVDSNASLTYGELNDRSDRLARRLRGESVGPGDLVGVALDRTVDMVVAIVAVWKCGAGYVPMDPGFPTERLAVMIEDAELATVVTSSNAVGGFGPRTEPDLAGLFDGLSVIDVEAAEAAPTGSHSCADAAVRPAGRDLAYVIFTSGSTGRPKGVAVEHRNVTNFLRSMAVCPGMTETDVMVAATTLSFDISVLELFLPLIVGGRVIVVDRDVAVDPGRLASVLAGATVAQGTPAMWKMLVDAGWTCDAGFKILCGGEALTRELGRSLIERSNSVWNMYGPTETTVWSAVRLVSEIDDSKPFVSIGSPIDNTRLYVLDGDHLAPDGMSGELWIGGMGVARGYLTSEEMTRDRFRPDPFHGSDERMYRTGDIVRRQPDGALDFLGRADGQIKLRGHRIELGEIESVLVRDEQIDQAVVVVRDFAEGDQRLVAYVTPAPLPGRKPGVDVAQVRAHVRSVLPAYMVPAAIVELDRLPFTPNKKIDRNALPHPVAEWKVPRPVHVGDLPHLSRVVEVYCDVLGSDISSDDDFFDVGGHSLLATRICSRLHRDLNCEVTVREVFENPTPRLVAALIDREPAGSARTAVMVSPGATAAGPAMSFSQERMLFLHELDPADTSYNLAGSVRMVGPLDRDALRRACAALVRRHSGLRTTFGFVDGEPRLEVHEPFDFQVPVFDQRSNDVDESIDAAVSHLRSTARQPFDLRMLPLFRFELHELAEDDHLLGLVMHHIISDRWSFGVLASDLGEFYSAAAAGSDLLESKREGPRPEAYARWHRDRLTNDRLEHHLSYWRRQLHDLPTVDYPSDRPRPTTRTGRAGATVSIEMSESLLEGIRRLSASEQSSEFMSLFAAFAVVIHQATGADDIPIGVPIANRHHLDSESLVTSLVNTVVVRTDLSGEPSFAELVRRVRETALDAYAHQDMPFERLVLELAPKRETRRSPLFQYFFNVQNAPFELPALDGIRLEAVHVPSAGAQFDISVTVDVALTKTITVDYSGDLFDEATMRGLLESYIEVLADAVAGRGSRIGSGEVVAGEPTADTRFVRDVATDGGTSPFELPRPGTECQLAAIWEEALGVSGLSRHDDFFDLGGYSLLAIRIFNEIENTTGRRLPMTALFEAPTIARLAAVLDSGGWLSPWTSLVRIRGEGTRAPVFYVAPFLISALSFHDLGRDVGADVPFYVLQPQGMDDDNPVHDRVEDMAAHYIRELKTVQPLGPYVIGGHCAGAWVAFEMVRQLEASGEVVDRLVVVDVGPPGIAAPKVDLARYVRSRLLLYGRSGRLFHALRWSLGPQVERLRNLSIARDDVRRTRGVRRRHAEAHQRYGGGAVRADIALIRSEEWAGLADKDWHLEWAALTSGATTTTVVEGTHAGLLTGASESLLAIALREAIDAR